MIDPATTHQLNDFGNFLKFKPTWIFKKFIHLPHKKIAYMTGNRAGKTAGVAYQYVLRILGLHPIPEKNVVYYECPEKHNYTVSQAGLILNANGKCSVCNEDIKEHERNCRIFRFCSSVKPGQSESTDDMGTSAEVQNTQYPEFKKWLPPFLIKSDITARNASMVIKDPYGGRDIITEYCSYSQPIQNTAGVSRLSIWLDEEAPYEYYDEQLPRLVEERGDIIFSITLTNGLSWMFDKIYEQANVYYRTKTMCEFMSKDENRIVEQEEHTSSSHPIAVLQAAMDDNPILDEQSINEIMGDGVDDPLTYSMRRYGIPKQASGRIFKDFEYGIHVIDEKKYFPEGLPQDWVFTQGIDYHPQTPWAVGLVALSPKDEMFIFGELNLPPERITTREMAYAIASAGRNYKFRLSLIDPLAKATKKDLRTIVDDLNDNFRELHREDIGHGAFWQTWDTKGEKGRNAIMMRLKNSKICKKPFNNTITEKGIIKIIPTLWIFNTCPLSIKSMQSWRWDEWVNATDRVAKVEKNTPQQKWSHFNMVYECILKEPSFRPGRTTMTPEYRERKERTLTNYFQAR